MPAIPLDVLVAARQALDLVMSDPGVPSHVKSRICFTAGLVAGNVDYILRKQTAVDVTVPPAAPGLPKGCEAHYTRSMVGERFSCARHCANGAHACKARHEAWASAPVTNPAEIRSTFEKDDQA